MYQSTFLEKYFAQAWETIEAPEKFVLAVEQNLFLSFFFAPLYERYHMVSNHTKTLMHIPIVPFCKSVAYEVQQKVWPNYTRFNTITVEQEGVVTDTRTQKDFQHRFSEAVFTGAGQSKKTTGKLWAKYQLDKATRVLQSLTARGSIDLNAGMSRRFEVQAYYLSERDHMIKDKKIAPITAQKEKEDEQ